jgi:hypothetical protein
VQRRLINAPFDEADFGQSIENRFCRRGGVANHQLQVNARIADLETHQHRR